VRTVQMRVLSISVPSHVSGSEAARLHRQGILVSQGMLLRTICPCPLHRKMRALRVQLSAFATELHSSATAVTPPPRSPDTECGVAGPALSRQIIAVQPEICSNISTAPVELYHRVQEAQQCLLHSLCVLPLWMPEITQKAPVAVLEILQPETQPDFESLHELVSPLDAAAVAGMQRGGSRARTRMQAAFALKDVTITKATVIEPMPELAGAVLQAERDDMRPEQPVSPEITIGRERCEEWREGGSEGRVVADGDAAPRPGGCASDSRPQECVVPSTRRAGSGEERMKMVFNDREAAENSDEHLKHVAERCAPARPPRAHRGDAPRRCALPARSGWQPS
jgi:hypothetical protein